jgi:hypothetical protein
MTIHTTTPGAVGPFFAPLQAYFGSLDSMAQSMSPLKSMARVQLEVTGFASRRAQAYLEIPSRLQQCRTPQDLFNEQARFWQTAFEQYAEASRRVTEAWQASLGAAASQPVSATARDYITFGAPARSTDAPKANGHDRRAA